jgi:glycosyltransferase involved in cell wall biosynthesis
VQVIRLGNAPVPRTGFVVNAARIQGTLRQLHAEHPVSILEGQEAALAIIPRDFPARKVIRMQGGHHFFAVTLGKKPRAWKSWLEKRSFANADALCAVSRYAAETTRSLLKLRPDRAIEILPNPVNTTEFAPRPQIPEERGLIVFVGTVTEKKGIRQLVQAMPRVVGAVPHAKLWVIGRDWPDPATGQSFTAHLRTLVPPELESHVVFKGPVEHSQLADTLARAQVCAYPSHMETQGIVIVEGMAMGKAVVATQAGPGPEVVENGVSGMLCDPHDPVSIAESIIPLLKDADLRRRLGEQARKRAVGEFSISSLVLRNEAFYARVLGTAHTRLNVETFERLNVDEENRVPSSIVQTQKRIQ